jgi:hypothetical protein
MQQWHITRLFSLDCYVKKNIKHLEISFGMANLLVHRIHLLRTSQLGLSPQEKELYRYITKQQF